MSDFTQDRETERQRYNTRAANQLGATLGPDGSDSVEPLLRRPYLVYEQHIRAEARPGRAVLDLCCGDGVHSLLAARLGADVTVADLAENNLAVARLRAQRAGVTLRTLVANAEHVPLPDASFDMITCAGSLSYLDPEKFLSELRRLLRPGGAFVFVDSLNHNPVYRFNRYVHYLRGKRSRSTLERMPTITTLTRIQADFPDLKIGYYGVFSFLTPVLRFLKMTRIATWLERTDFSSPAVRRHAFKIVGIGHRSAAP